MRIIKTYSGRDTQIKNTLPEGAALNPHSTEQCGIVQPDCIRNEAVKIVLDA